MLSSFTWFADRLTWYQMFVLIPVIQAVMQVPVKDFMGVHGGPHGRLSVATMVPARYN